MTGNFRYPGGPTTVPSKELDTFEKPQHITMVRFVSEELTSLCPVNGQSNFYRAEIEYRPDKLCIRSKSLKLYLWNFRNEAMFAEHLANDITQHICETIQLHAR